MDGWFCFFLTFLLSWDIDDAGDAYLGHSDWDPLRGTEQVHTTGCRWLFLFCLYCSVLF